MRAAIGPVIDLMVDVNNAGDATTAPRVQTDGHNVPAAGCHMVAAASTVARKPGILLGLGETDRSPSREQP